MASLLDEIMRKGVYVSLPGQPMSLLCDAGTARRIYRNRRVVDISSIVSETLFGRAGLRPEACNVLSWVVPERTDTDSEWLEFNDPITHRPIAGYRLGWNRVGIEIEHRPGVKIAWCTVMTPHVPPLGSVPFRSSVGCCLNFDADRQITSVGWVTMLAEGQVMTDDQLESAITATPWGSEAGRYTQRWQIACALAVLKLSEDGIAIRKPQHRSTRLEKAYKRRHGVDLARVDEMQIANPASTAKEIHQALHFVKAHTKTYTDKPLFGIPGLVGDFHVPEHWAGNPGLGIHAPFES